MCIHLESEIKYMTVLVYKLIPQSFMTVTIQEQHKNTIGEGKGKGIKEKLAKRFIHVIINNKWCGKIFQCLQ